MVRLLALLYLANQAVNVGILQGLVMLGKQGFGTFPRKASN